MSTFDKHAERHTLWSKEARMRTQLKSIRWRLPLSYIGVALLAALASGVLMLVTLRGYYRQRELDYLQTNARQIGRVAQQLLQAGAPEAERVLADQIVHWSFLLQVRVQVLGTDGQMLADSGSPRAQQVMMVSGAPEVSAVGASIAPTDTFSLPLPLPGMFILSSDAPAFGGDVVVNMDCREEAEGAMPPECAGQPVIVRYAAGGPAGGAMSFTQAITEPIGPIGVAMPLAGSLYGFELEAPAELAERTRSGERVEQPILNAGGQRLGVVVLSDGPAYGREILLSALAAWAAASLMAMMLAGLAGAWVSRRITVPLLALTQVTENMAAGNLAARADANAANEFGQLGRSFNGMAERVSGTIHTLRRFVADAAHELNTPLTALQTNLELAASADDSARGEWLARAQTQIERLRDLVTGLLNLSRLEGQGGAPQREAVNLVALTQAISEAYASRAEQAGLTFELELPAAPGAPSWSATARAGDEAAPAAPLLTQGDPAQLHRALENLLENAIKFTPAGGEVRLSIRQLNERIALSVEDTGIGVPPEDRPLLFQRFHRGRNAASYPGNGLGLAIVHAIAEAHGGAVTAASTGRGTCFTLHLPLQPQPTTRPSPD
jgi:signal transduction histidine kinase